MQKPSPYSHSKTYRLALHLVELWPDYYKFAYSCPEVGVYCSGVHVCTYLDSRGQKLPLMGLGP